MTRVAHDSKRFDSRWVILCILLGTSFLFFTSLPVTSAQSYENYTGIKNKLTLSDVSTSSWNTNCKLYSLTTTGCFSVQQNVQILYPDGSYHYLQTVLDIFLHGTAVKASWDMQWFDQSSWFAGQVPNVCFPVQSWPYDCGAYTTLTSVQLPVSFYFFTTISSSGQLDTYITLGSETGAFSQHYSRSISPGSVIPHFYSAELAIVGYSGEANVIFGPTDGVVQPYLCLAGTDCSSNTDWVAGYGDAGLMGSPTYVGSLETAQNLNYATASSGLASFSYSSIEPAAGWRQGVADLDLLSVSASSYPATGGLTPLNVIFAATIVGGRNVYTIQWNFGDGSPTDSNRNTSHIYTTIGTFTWTLTVSDTSGQQLQKTGTIQVYGYQLQVLSAPTSPVSIQYSGSFYSTGTNTPFVLGPSTSPLSEQLTAPRSDSSGNVFAYWQVNGMNQPTGQVTVSVSVSSTNPSQTAVAVYQSQGQYVIHVSSVPVSGVQMQYSTDASTWVPFTTPSDVPPGGSLVPITVSLRAPQNPSGYSFLYWTVYYPGGSYPGNAQCGNGYCTIAVTVDNNYPTKSAVASYSSGSYTTTVTQFVPSTIVTTSNVWTVTTAVSTFVTDVTLLQYSTVTATTQVATLPAATSTEIDYSTTYSTVLSTVYVTGSSAGSFPLPSGIPSVDLISIAASVLLMLGVSWSSLPKRRDRSRDHEGLINDGFCGSLWRSLRAFKLPSRFSSFGLQQRILPISLILLILLFFVVGSPLVPKTKATNWDEYIQVDNRASDNSFSNYGGTFDYIDIYNNVASQVWGQDIGLLNSNMPYEIIAPPSITYNGISYVFDHWEVAPASPGSLVVNTPTSDDTKFTATGSGFSNAGTLTAVYVSHTLIVTQTTYVGSTTYATNVLTESTQTTSYSAVTSYSTIPVTSYSFTTGSSTAVVTQVSVVTQLTTTIITSIMPTVTQTVTSTVQQGGTQTVSATTTTTLTGYASTTTATSMRTVYTTVSGIVTSTKTSSISTTTFCHRCNNAVSTSIYIGWFYSIALIGYCLLRFKRWFPKLDQRLGVLFMKSRVLTGRKGDASLT